jgi:hypothetical protein
VAGRLSTDQRIGQLFLLGLGGDQLGEQEREEIRDHHIGSVWFTQTTFGGIDATRTIVDAVQGEATDEATGGVRFFVAAN